MRISGDSRRGRPCFFLCSTWKRHPGQKLSLSRQELISRRSWNSICSDGASEVVVLLIDVVEVLSMEPSEQ